MAGRRNALGRGLGALIPSAPGAATPRRESVAPAVPTATEPQPTGPVEIPVERIDPNRLLNRKWPASRDRSALILIARVPESAIVAHPHSLVRRLLLVAVGTILLVAVVGWHWARSASLWSTAS